MSNFHLGFLCFQIQYNYFPDPKYGEGNVFKGDCTFTPRRVPQSQVLSQVSGPRSFLGVPKSWPREYPSPGPGSTQVLAQGVPQSRPREYPSPSPGSTPVLARGVPQSQAVTQLGLVYPLAETGYHPLAETGVPPSPPPPRQDWGTPCLGLWYPQPGLTET